MNTNELEKRRRRPLALTRDGFAPIQVNLTECVLSGFAAHPRYLEVAEALRSTVLWEQRGPPDFCEKLGGQCVCE